jgi:hypothetical protein
MIDVLVEAVDDCVARFKKSGWRGLDIQGWLIAVGAMLLAGTAVVVVIGLLFV